MYNIQLKRKPIYAMLFLLLGFCLFQVVGALLTIVPMKILGLDMQSQVGTILLLGISSLSLFVGTGWFFSRTAMKGGCQGFSFGSKNDVKTYSLLIFFMTLLAIPISTYLGELNQAIPFPDALSGLESWLHELEKESMTIIKKLLSVTSLPYMLANLVVVAVIPAIGEEIVFRGIIQRMLFNKVQNAHKAIWLAAIIFSVLHFEFSGMIPRIFLGALLGYIYYWTGSLWMSIWAHFVNNGTLVVLAYLSSKGILGIDVIENDIPMAQLSGYMMMAVVLFVPAVRSLYAKRKHFVSSADQSIESDPMS
ncbi:CPBP family intramembrane metalloprotease [Halosquirtibacter xylanolyticus]|uniref:CPBP family intramembrane glutamic endopeptidase n=1 Tax=Halosquirtibacter xylanolyticus TaxID=3374599 RepID=UPI003748F3A0|nr:CPBP family intramembrane metalloprotease [Prolixibacteraceae bacterium]